MWGDCWPLFGGAGSRGAGYGALGCPRDSSGPLVGRARPWGGLLWGQCPRIWCWPAGRWGQGPGEPGPLAGRAASWVAGVGPRVGATGPKAQAGLLEGRTGGPRAGACPLVGRSVSQGLWPHRALVGLVPPHWWAGPRPKDGCELGGLKAACLLVGGAVPLPS